MKKQLYVFDLDGVLLSSAHRYKTDKTGTRIDLEHWRRNSTPSKIALDKPLPLAKFYKECLADINKTVVIATARVVCETTLQVIKGKLGLPDLIHGRQFADDPTSGAVFKIDAVGLAGSGFDEVSFFDDNKAYIKAFKAAHPSAKTYFIPSDQGH